MQQHRKRERNQRDPVLRDCKGGFQMLLTPLRIALLVAVVFAYGLAVHLFNVPTR